MATLHASDVSGGSHHDALLVLRDLPFLKDKYTVEYIWLGASSPRARSDNDTSPRTAKRRTDSALDSPPLVPHLLRGSPGGNDGDLRSKTKTLEGPIRSLDDLPRWNFDGSSTNQAPGVDSEVCLVPRKIFRDPFRATPQDRAQVLHADSVNAQAPSSPCGPAQAALASAAAAAGLVPRSDADDSAVDGVRGEVFGGCRNLLVVCDTYTPAGDPIPTNTRASAARIFNVPDVAAEEPWFGIEQEYTLLDAVSRWPLGWPPGGYPAPQGPYYCGVGSDRMFGRHIAEAHYRACHYAGVEVSGLNAEVMPGQWEFQVGPCVGVDAGDQLWAARYILQRVCELTGNVVVTLDPKPVPGDWNGAGAHTNYSTRSMRHRHLGGMREIERAILRLRDRHAEHIEAYGCGNERRLTGKHETAAMSDFTWGIADRGASIRVGNDTYRDGCGYLEDRRPSANCDPYVVTGLLAKTTLAVEDECVRGTLRLPCAEKGDSQAVLPETFGGIALGNGGDVGDQNDSSASSAAARGNDALG